MRKVVVWSIVLTISHLVIFFGGVALGGRISKNFLFQEFEKANAPIMLNHYVQFRDFAKSIETGDLDNAKCSAQLGASANLDDVRDCLADENCKAAIEKDVLRLAPEIVSRGPLDFDYKKREGSVRRCK